MKPENKISSYNIKALRAFESLTQSEFGKKYSSNVKSLCSYETGNIRPSMEFTLALAKAFDFPPEYLSTIKLKIDGSGKITNLPTSTAKIAKVRSEFTKLFNDFEKSFDDFKKAVGVLYAGIEKVNQRINELEKQVSKKR